MSNLNPQLQQQATLDVSDVVLADNDNVFTFAGLQPGPFKFKDDVWDLKEWTYNGQQAPPQKGTCNVLFNVNPDSVKNSDLQRLVKMFILAGLAPPAVAKHLSQPEKQILVAQVRTAVNIKQTELRPSTAQSRTAQLTAGLRAIENVCGGQSVTSSQWDDVSSELLKTNLPNSARHVVRLLQNFDAFARLLLGSHVDVFGSRPWGGKSPKNIIPKSVEERDPFNQVKADRRCLEWFRFCNWLIDELGDDIISYVKKFIGDVPVYDHSGRTLRHFYRVKNVEAPRLVVPAGAGGGTAPVNWLGTDTPKWKDVKPFALALADACMYVVSFTTALRKADLFYIDQKCVQNRNSKTKQPTIRGWRTKGQGKTPHGVSFPATPIMIRAVDTMNKLAAAWELPKVVIEGVPNRTDRHHLFVSFGGSGSGRLWNDRSRKTVRDASNLLSDRGAIIEALDPEFEPTSRVMRITALVEYAAGECGLALASEFGLWSSSKVRYGYIGDIPQRLVRVSERYEENLDPDFPFRTELDAVRDQVRAGRMALLLKSEIEEEGSVVGNGVSRMERIFNDHSYEGMWSEVQHELANPQPLTASQIIQIGTYEKPLHLLPHTYCHFDPSTAACGGTGLSRPETCQPGRCDCSTMTPGQVAMVEVQRRRTAKNAENNPKNPVYQQALDYWEEHFPTIEEDFEEIATFELLQRRVDEGNWLFDFIANGPKPEEEVE